MNFIDTVNEIKQASSATISFPVTLIPNIEKVDLDSHGFQKFIGTELTPLFSQQPSNG